MMVKQEREIDLLLNKIRTNTMKSISLFCMILCVIQLSSCVKEPVSDEHSLEKNVITFTLSNSSAPTQATRVTRAADDMLDNEKVIHRIDIFFFDVSGSHCLFYPDASQVAIADNRVTVRVPESVMTSFYGIGNCKMYMLANCQLSREVLAGKTLDEIKLLSMDNMDEKKFNVLTPPSNFLMDSEEIDVIFNENSPNSNLGKISLKRAAAKVIVDITSAKRTGYTAVKATVMVVNYLDKTRLSSEYLYPARNEDYKSASKTLIANNDVDNSFSIDTQNPIYTYATNWANAPDRETFLLIAIDWRKQEGGEVRTYYYRIPFSYIRATGDVEANKEQIRRNYVYQFAVNVSRLGGLDPADAVDLSANFELLDWTTKEVEVSILGFHFLFVYNPHVEIHNRHSNVWEFRSSKQPVTITINSVYSNEYDSNGGINQRDYTAGNPQYPKVTQWKDASRTYFTFESMVPINYVPLYMKATVTNGTGLSADVTLTIYPKIYVTASYSYGGYSNQTANNPDDKGIIPSNAASALLDGQTIWLAGSYNTPTGVNKDAGNNTPNGSPKDTPPQKNFNFFTVHVTSLDIEDENAGMRVGDPTQPMSHLGATAGVEGRETIKLTIPWDITYFRTQQDVESNNIVSPQFVIASQRGITATDKSWEVAQQRCATYRESQYAAGTWRMPTLAELKLVRRMQLDPNSAIKELFQSTNASGWWTAQYGYAVMLGQSDDALAILNDPLKNHSVRCIRDLWRD